MRYVDLGLSDYKEAYRVQREIWEQVVGGTSGNTLIITEHKSVITIGRAGSRDNIFKTEGIEVLNIDRGGDVTYHGPGQLIAYPIFRLENEARDIHGFLKFLEETGIDFLSKYGVEAEARPGLRGIWVKDEKIGSIGIGVKKWVTYHGMAININPDLKYFSFIKPCGISGVKITSLEALLKEKVGIEDAKLKFRESFKEVSLLAEAVHKRQ
ncbi:MAG: octanoyltransferase [Candidatus Omnitrophica bacterium CG22_combo_CG10-13_8_21_14_all_43_16]|nr:MAG: octanoyltransferase [Candidatus Omnitrophica bacterium CG22_combo_CG10-13_8_21_14_all_43_16]